MNLDARKTKLWDAITDLDERKMIHYSKELIKKGIPNWDNQTKCITKFLLDLYDSK